MPLLCAQSQSPQPRGLSESDLSQRKDHVHLVRQLRVVVPEHRQERLAEQVIILCSSGWTTVRYVICHCKQMG